MKRSNPSTIRDCTVAVTGGAGFLGSHLVKHLIEDRGCKVIVIDNLCAGRMDFIHPEATFVHHDISSSEEFLHNLFIKHEVRFVFNYAAWPYVPDSYARPMQVFNTNAVGAIKVINAAQEAGCEAILQVSSAELYGRGWIVETTTPENKECRTYGVGSIDEEAPVAPHSTYGAAKAAADYYCQCAWKERKTPVISLRQFNSVGESDILHPYVIPAIIGQLMEGKRDGMYYRVDLGNNSERDFLYAGDAVRMAVELLEKGSFGEVYNSGSEQSVKMYDLATMIGQLMKRDCVVRHDKTRDRAWEIWSLRSCNDKLFSVIDYRPNVPLEVALARTIGSLGVLASVGIWNPKGQ